MKLAVIGQGYVGLPLAMRAVEVGYDVVGIDLDQYRVGSLRAGSSFVDDVSDEELNQAIGTGRYKATVDYADASDFDFAVITVPTPLRDSLPDLSFIESAAKSIGPHLREGATVVLESTTYPGTTGEVLVPMLEEHSGLTAGISFHVGYSPERIDPGNTQWGFKNTPKVVSGIDQGSLKVVTDFYGTLVETTIQVSSPKEAELTKLLENTFRHVNIALVNELAIFADKLGVNVWEAIDAASTKPFGFMRFTPGPGVGGHCLPVDPSYLSWEVRRKLGHNFRFVELANDINDHMPEYVVQRATHMLNSVQKSVSGSSIGLLGLSYKKNTGDIREAPSLKLIDLLHGLGATLVGFDDHVESHRWPANVGREDLSLPAVSSLDLVIALTAHDDFDLSVFDNTETLVLDTQNVLIGSNVQTL